KSALVAVGPDLHWPESTNSRRQRPDADDVAQIGNLRWAQHPRRAHASGNQIVRAAGAQPLGQRHGARRARAIDSVFAFALPRRYDFGVKSRAILVDYLQGEFGAMLACSKAKAHPAPEKSQRRIIEQPDVERGAAGA